jgi:DNA-binding Lrp family transcriptional regulator
LIDKLDVELIRELFQGIPGSPIRPEIKLSYRALANRLGVSEGTIRTRVGRLEEPGFIQGYAVHPHPSLIDVEVYAVSCEVSSPSKQSVVDTLKLVEGVYVMVDYHGPFIGLVLLSPSQNFLKRKVELISKLSGSGKAYPTRIPFPPCRYSLSQLDWRIILSLQRDVKKSYQRVAREIDVSTRTVKRRITSLIRAGAVFLLPSADEAALKGTLRADLWVEWPREGKREIQEKILEIVHEYSFWSLD